MANTTRKKTAQDYLLENAARLEKISGKSVHYETGEKEAAPGSKKLARAVDGVKTKTADDAMRENAVRLEKISSAQRTFGLALQTADRELAKARNADRYTDRMAAAAADYARKADEMLNNGGRLRGETVGDMLKEIRPTVENRSAAQAALHNITEPGSTTPAQSVPVGRVPYAPVRVGAADRVPTAYDNATFTVKTGPGPYIEEFAQSQHDKMQAKAEEAMQEYAKYAPYRSDFAEVSARAGEDTKIKHTPEEAAKLKQERLNRQAIGGGILNPSASNEQELIDEWIDQRDVDTYNYLVNSGLKDYADAYWETVMADAQKKRTGEVQEFVKAAPDGFAEKALGSALSVGYNLSNEAAGGMYTIDQGVRSYLGDEKANISPYGVAFHGGWTRDALREDAMEGMGDVGKFIYQTGMSAADSMANLAFGSPLAPVMLGAGAMADTARDVKLRGGTDEQALGMGVVAGAAEILTEKMGFGRLGDLIGGTKGNVLRAVLGHMTSEFGEEAGTEIANLFADWAIMKDKSQYAQMVEEFGGGKEGTRRAWLEMLKQVGLSGLGGALSGAAMGGSSAAIGKAYQQMQNRSADRRLTQAIEKAAEQAAQNETAQNAPVDVSEAAMQVADRELGEEAGAAQAGAQGATEAPAAQPRTEAENQTVNQTANQTANQTVAEAPDAQKQQYMDTAQKYGEKYGDGAALVFARNYDGGDIQTYDRAFNALYTAGRAGLTLDKVGKVTDALTAGMSDVTKRAILQAGANSTMSEVTPGVRRMYTVKTTDVQKRQIAMLNEIGRKYGVEIDVVDSIRAGDYAANGMYNGGRKIVVALDAAEGAIVQAGVHELTHYLKRTDADAYEVLKSVVLDHLQASDTFYMNIAVSERKAQYAGQNMTDEDIVEEIVAEAVPTFLTDEKAVRAFVSENRPLAQKIRDFFVKFAEEIRQIAERYRQRDGAERYEIANLLGRSDALTEIARTFDAALEAASEAQEAETGETVYARTKRKYNHDDDYEWNRALKPGEMKNEFWQSMSSEEWKEYYQTLNGELYNPDYYVGGARATMVHGDKLLFMEMQKTGEFTLVAVYRSSEPWYNLDTQYMQNKWRDGKYDAEKIEAWVATIAADDGAGVFESYDRHSRRFVRMHGKENSTGRGTAGVSGGRDAHGEGLRETSFGQAGAVLSEVEREAVELSDIKTSFSLRTEDPPKKTMKGYKVFVAFANKPGELYPPMVANPGGESTPVGVWLNADEGVTAKDKEGKELTNTLGRKQVKAGGKGTQGGSGALAYRPGWHLGEVPMAKQFARLNPETGEKDLFPENFIWAECEFAADVDYQEEAMSYGYNKNGKFQHSLAGLPKLPKDGYYTYRTNPDPTTVPWYITGAMKVTRILSDEETDAILRENGVEPMKRKGGPIDLAKYGFTAGDVSSDLTETQTRLIESNQPVSGATETKWSLARNEEFMDDARKVNAKTGNVDAETMGEAAEARAEVKAYMEEHGEVMRLPADIEGNTFFADGAYGGSEESTSVCIRSMAAQELMDLVAKDLGRPLTVEDTLVISQDIAGYTDKPECYYCYVAQDRRAIREFLGTYMQQRDDVLKRYRAGEDRNQVYQDWLDGRKDTKNMRDRFAMWTKAVDSGTALITPKDLASMEDLNAEITTLQTRIAEAIGGKVQFAALGYKQDGGRTKNFASVLKTADAALKADINRYIQLADALQYAKSASWAKKQSGYAAYNGHILKWNADKVKGFNDHYGLRMYSFSDFSPAFILENMQMITDAAVKGLKVLAYTKELDFVRVFAPTGANINISVFAQEINGEITSDGMMGADWAEAIRLRGKYPNVGVTFVATSDKLAAWAEAQDWIDTVIPYHLVRTGTKVANYFGYKNYTAESSDKKKPGIKFKKGDVTSIPPEMHGNDIVRYVRALEEHNLTPRFENRMVGYREFLAGEMSEDEFRAANPYYMKYVNETRRSAQETPIVRPKFEVAPAITAMENLIKEGGYGAPIGQSYEVMQEIAEEIADKIRAGAAQNQPKFSLSNVSPATSITDENQNLSLPVDVKVSEESVRAQARKALDAADNALTERVKMQIRGIANKIMRETGSSYSKETFAENMEALVRQYAEDGWTEETLKAVTEMAKKIIETSERADNSLREQYADVRKRLKESGVALTETQKQEAANLSGGYGEYRKSVFGTVNLKDEGMTLESLWNELSEQHPEIFTPGANEGDQVRILQEFAYLMRPKYENPYGMDMDGAALEMAMRIEGDIMGMIGAKDAAKAMYGSVEKLRSQFEQEYREKLKQQKAERVQKFQQIAADLKAAKAKGDGAEQAKIMGRYRAAMKSTGLDEAYAEIRATLKAREEAKAETAKSREMREKVTKQASELMNLLAKPPKGKRIPTGLQQMVMDVLDMLDINGAKAAEAGRETVQAKEFKEKLNAVREFYTDVASKQSAGEAPAGMDGLMMAFTERNLEIMNEALEVLGGGDKFRLRDMNSEQLKSLSELMKNIRHTVDSVGKMWKNHRYQSVVELGNASIDEMGERGKQKINETIAAGKGRDFLALDMMEPVSYGERLGEAGSTVIQSLMDGEKEKFAKVKAATEATAKMLKDIGVTGYDIGGWKRHTQTVTFGSGAKVKMTDAMIMSLYLTAQRPQGRQHLLGNGMRIPTTKETGAQVDRVLLSESDLAMIAGKLDDKQRRLADAMQAYLSTDVAKWGNDVTQRLYLYDAFTEGKYWPLTSDPNVLKTQEPEGDRAFSAILNAGFTKPLNEKANNPVIITDAFDVFGRHIGEMASYAGYAEVMTDVMAWINYRQRTEEGLIGGTVKESMEKLLGSGGVKYLTKLVQDINGARRGGDNLQLDGLVGRTRKAAVVGKIRVALQQPTSIVRAAAEINPIYLIRAMKPTWGSVKEMQKYSSLAWWKSNGNYEIGVGKSTDAMLWGDTSKWDTAERIGTRAITLGLDPGKLDDLTWSRIWEAAKLETKRRRKDLKVGSEEYFKAVTERFEAICDRTQVVDTVMHRSDIMRSKDGLMKSLTSFMGEPIKSYNMLMRSVMEAGRNPKDAKVWGKLARTGAAYVASVAATSAATALFDALKYRDDDDPLWEYLLNGGFAEDWTERWLKNFIGSVNPLENIPIVADAYAALFGGEEPTMMQFQLFKDAYDAGMKIKDYFLGSNEKKLTLYGAVAPAAKFVGELTGLPVPGLMANAEMLMHAFDPKLLQTKSDMQTMGEAYDKLYKAIADGDRKEELDIRTEIARGLYGNDAKTPKEIDTGIAEALAWNDERILRAWQLRQNGRIGDLTALYKTIQKDGFTDEVVKKAANRVEGLMNTKYNAALEDGKAEEAEAIRAKAAKYGMVLTKKAEKDMDEELEAKTIEYKQLYEAIRSGDDEDIAVAYEVMLSESDAKDPEEAVRDKVSGEFRKEYIDLMRSGKTAEAEKLGRKLEVFGLDEDTRAKWVADSYKADVRTAITDGDKDAAVKTVGILRDEYGLTDKQIGDYLDDWFKDEYLAKMASGDERGADALAEIAQELDLRNSDGNIFRQQKLNKWVTDWEKAQDEE